MGMRNGRLRRRGHRGARAVAGILAVLGVARLWMVWGTGPEEYEVGILEGILMSSENIPGAPVERITDYDYESDDGIDDDDDAPQGSTAMDYDFDDDDYDDDDDDVFASAPDRDPGHPENIDWELSHDDDEAEDEDDDDKEQQEDDDDDESNDDDQEEDYVVDDEEQEEPETDDATGEEEYIREWGCGRTEAPLVFVHIGKAGGGRVRARLAAAALDYDRGQHWKQARADHHYYPMENDAKGKFCHSAHRNHRPPSLARQPSYEGSLPCNATTPLGMALACPEATYLSRPKTEKRPTTGAAEGLQPFCLRCRASDEACHSVYAGHNLLGSEFHWLPPAVLQEWWATTGRDLVAGGQGDAPSRVVSTRAADGLALLDRGFGALMPGDPSWCPGGEPRPNEDSDAEALYEDCGAPLAARADGATRALLRGDDDYSFLYASLPVQRVVQLRDPWSWLVSKFFWHKLDERGWRCDDVHRATGWATPMLWKHLFHLCGDDCPARHEAGMLSAGQAEAQAGSNLRTAVSVVGLLNETEAFYEMLDARVAYLNTSLHPRVTGEAHSSRASPEHDRCAAVFQTDDAFRESFRASVPLVARLERLYQLGVRVNRFQKRELEECSRPS